MLTASKPMGVRIS